MRLRLLLMRRLVSGHGHFLLSSAKASRSLAE